MKNFKKKIKKIKKSEMKKIKGGMVINEQPADFGGPARVKHK